MTDLLTGLQGAVGDAYRIEKELGGGGMSRVFLAEDVELGRRVVIKVLPPEMAAGVNQERFRREIQLAARLQHPHVVPLLSAGSGDDLLYYMMPYIEGESLRAKLAREGELPVGEAVRILKEVVDALAYAHEHGVVHRDIKPDNVLLSGKHAVVTDFGVAKAVSASTGESSLTSLGVALGTPAYMAPEQAVADPHVDHRADIYAVGAMAYEMLTGRPPFSGPNPQAVLSAHVTDVPEPATKYRATVPDALNAVVMRCLEKKAADRWQNAEELLPHLDAILTPTGGITPTGTVPVAAIDYEAAARQAHPVRVAALFGLASAAVLALVYFIMYQLGLPDWVFLGAVVLLAIGLPIMLLTGHRERQQAIATMTGVAVATPTGVRRHFTWRRSLLGGGVAFAGLGVIAAGYMTMRALGIGPAATLVTSGILEERERIILAEFENRTTDSLIGPAVTEALRIDLARSPIVTLLTPDEVHDVLRSMERNVDAPLDAALARDVAMREGLKAVVAGEINAAGAGYVLSLRVVSPEDGAILTAERETADDQTEVIAAIDRLSRKLRERIGESLKSIRAGAPLGKVTTPSLEALQKYSQAIRAIETEDDPDKGVTLLEEAIALDTGFAMAYRKLGIALQARGERAGRNEALTKAFEHRDRVTEVERFHVDAMYHFYITEDRERVAAIYRRFVDAYPDSVTAWYNLGVAYMTLREWALAEEAYLEGVARGGFASHGGAMSAQINQGGFARAESTMALLVERFPEHPAVWWRRANLAFARGDYDEAAAHVRDLRQLNPANLSLRAQTAEWLAVFARHTGRLAEAKRHLRDRMHAEEERRLPSAYLNAAMDLAWLDVWWRERPADGLRQIELALERYPLDSLPAADRPYPELAGFYARAGKPQDARRFVAQFEEMVDPAVQRTRAARHWAAGEIALAEGKPQKAIQHFERWDAEVDFCNLCALPQAAEAYDRAGEADSAIAFYERYLNTPSAFRQFVDNTWRARSYKRLGELYEERGDSRKAVEYYDKFVELWADADPELQPIVGDVKDRIARLVGER